MVRLTTPIRLRCPNCHSKLKGSDALLGRTISCPACEQPFAASEADVVDDGSSPPSGWTAATSNPAAPPPSNPVRKLITCSACGKSISPAARACPGCGEPDRYVHPEIQRFLDSARASQALPPFSYKIDGFVLSGWAAVQKGALGASMKGSRLFIAGSLMGLFGAGLPFLLPIAGLLILVGLFMSSATAFSGFSQADYVSRFSIDFNATPPKWESGDEALWKPVKDVLLKPAPAPRP